MRRSPGCFGRELRAAGSITTGTVLRWRICGTQSVELHRADD